MIEDISQEELKELQEELKEELEEAKKRVDTHCWKCKEKLGDDYIEEETLVDDNLGKGYRRYHKDCYKERQDEFKEASERARERREKEKKLKQKQKEGKEDIVKSITLLVKGRKGSFKDFKEAIKEIAEENNVKVLN